MVKRTLTITTILLILTMAVSLIVVLNKSSLAADDDIASGISGSCSWVIDSEGVLTISPTDGVSGTLASNSSSFIYSSWNSNNSSITKVVVNNGVKTNTSCINLFKGLTKCTEMDLDNLDTSAATNMYYMFSNCSSLNSLDLSNFNTANVTNMAYMFYGCTGLTSLDLTSFNTENVTSMSYMFYGCANAETIDVSSFNTSNVSGMAYMFRDCAKLKSLDLKHFDTSNITSMACMFYHDYALETLDISTFDTSNVKSMYWTFDGCTVLKELDVSNFDTSKVTDMSLMFGGCKALTSLDLSSFDTSEVKDMQGVFFGDSKLETITINPDKFNTSKVTNMNLMFGYCYKLKTMDVSKFDTSSATDISEMFLDCNQLEAIDVSNFNTSKVTTLEAMFLRCYKIEYLDLSGFDTSKVNNMDLLFGLCNNLKRVELGENFSFKGNNIEDTSKQAKLNNPRDNGCTGKWIREDESYGPYTPQELTDNYDGSIMAGTWVWEKDKNDYTLSYAYEGTVPEGASELPANETHKSGDWVEVAPDATAPGYTFSGWSYSDFYMPSNNVEIIGSFRANRDTPYRVEHYLEDTTTGTFILEETEELTGRTGLTKKASPKTYAGYTFDSTIEGTIQQGKIAGDGSLVLKLYYRRNETPSENGHKYKVQYYFDEELDEDLDEIINADVDSEVSVNPVTPIKHRNKNYTLVSDNHKITITVNDEDNVIKIYYETDVLDYAIDGDEDEIEGDGIPDKYQIRITYRVQNGSWNDGTNNNKVNVITLYDKDGKPSENGTGTTQIPEVGSKPNKGYTYGYWNKNIPSKVTKNDNGKTYVYSYETTEAIKTDIAGGKGKSSNPKTDDVMNRYLLAGVGGILVLMLVSRIRRRYSRKAKKIQF